MRTGHVVKAKQHGKAHGDSEKKSMIQRTKKAEKKHDSVHEENGKKARFSARRKRKKSTIQCTKKAEKKHDSVHEESGKKARFSARNSARRKRKKGMDK